MPFTKWYTCPSSFIFPTTLSAHFRLLDRVKPIPAAAGLYCVLQQQALVNKSAHYGKKARVWTLSGKCVLKRRLMGSMLVADLSPHNPRSRRFLRELGRGTWDEMTDPKDCSVARGIGLAIAETRTFLGLAVETVRESERSAEERGDHLVLFASPGTRVPPLPGGFAETTIWPLRFGKESTPIPPNARRAC